MKIVLHIDLRSKVLTVFLRIEAILTDCFRGALCLRECDICYAQLHDQIFKGDFFQEDSEKACVDMTVALCM